MHIIAEPHLHMSYCLPTRITSVSAALGADQTQWWTTAAAAVDGNVLYGGCNYHLNEQRNSQLIILPTWTIKRTLTSTETRRNQPHQLSYDPSECHGSIRGDSDVLRVEECELNDIYGFPIPVLEGYNFHDICDVFIALRLQFVGLSCRLLFALTK